MKYNTPPVIKEAFIAPVLKTLAKPITGILKAKGPASLAGRLWWANDYKNSVKTIPGIFKAKGSPFAAKQIKKF